ncbi:MAG: hypothetical protein JRD89_17710 [Deltaproteobacteria bacterium]|nr:hypothetical protein [Deltaproteobacteria bacterium]
MIPLIAALAPEEGRRPIVEITTREALIAVMFVLMVIIAVALVQAGIITNPITLGLMLTLTIGLILVGHALIRIGFLPRGMLPLWYVLTFGIVMLVYGFVESGVIPAAFVIYGASIHEIALTNALFYVFVALAIFAAVVAGYFGYQYWKKRALGAIRY